MRPMSKADAQKEREGAERTRKARRSVFACGVDGLEPGHRYRVDVARGPLLSFWWRWGTRDEVLGDEREEGDEGDGEEGMLEVEDMARRIFSRETLKDLGSSATSQARVVAPSAVPRIILPDVRRVMGRSYHHVCPYI